MQPLVSKPKVASVSEYKRACMALQTKLLSAYCVQLEPMSRVVEKMVKEC